jgi:phenylpropionate dioxygenase-like ring-hydroxylating dioxygenase large terminal subunit
MLTREENDLVTRVGPGTPLGDTLRRYWLPVCTSEQIAGADSKPLRVRLLGENFIAFRDTEGKVGLLDELCMHRGASLALGRVEDCGIRCLYHGWKFAIDGTILETPNHGDPAFRTRQKARAYPMHEAGGLVWTYLGPREKEPPFARYRFMDVPAGNRTVVRINVNANYLQLWEGGADSSHVGILHSDMARPGWVDKTFQSAGDVLNPGTLVSDDMSPRLELEDTEFGFHYAAWRKTGRKDENGVDIDNCRIVPLIMPWTRIIPSPTSYYTVFEVAEDDENTATYIVVDSLVQAVDRDRIMRILGLDDPRFYDPTSCDFLVTAKTIWGQDREKMKSNWTGLRGLEQEDAVMSMSMGPIMDRTKEHLVAADRAVMRLRRRILENIRTVAQGGDAMGAGLADLSRLVAIDVDLPAGGRWQDAATGNIEFASAAE